MKEHIETKCENSLVRTAEASLLKLGSLVKTKGDNGDRQQFLLLGVALSAIDMEVSELQSDVERLREKAAAVDRNAMRSAHRVFAKEVGRVLDGQVKRVMNEVRDWVKDVYGFTDRQVAAVKESREASKPEVRSKTNENDATEMTKGYDLFNSEYEVPADCVTVTDAKGGRTQVCDAVRAMIQTNSEECLRIKACLEGDTNDGRVLYMDLKNADRCGDLVIGLGRNVKVTNYEGAEVGRVVYGGEGDE